MVAKQSSTAAQLADERTTRQQQGEETAQAIVKAAREVFAEKGFLGASTRDIARHANTNQGLITYHFKSKEALWRAAADSLFNELGERLTIHIQAIGETTQRSAARSAIKEYVRFVAEHPELFRLMVDEGKVDDDRLKWLIETHMKPIYEAILKGLLRVAGLDATLLPHAFYALAGASSLIFAVAPECRRLTGLDPETEVAIERHAEFVAHMLVPNQNS